MTCPAAFNQKTFRGRNDDGNETTATWKATQGTDFSQLQDTAFRIRFEIQETAACAGANKVWRLQYNKNAAGWVTVNATSLDVKSVASPNLADAENLTNQLTLGTGTFQGATGFDEVDGAAGGASMDVAASGHAECEFSIQLLSADVNPGDTIQLRVTDNGTALAAYADTPTITVDSGTVTVTPGVGDLVLTGFAPTVQLPITVTPGVGALDLTGFAPTVVTPTQVTPGVGAITLTGFAPTVQTPVTVTPGVGALNLTGFAPTVQTPVTVTPGVGALELTGFSPSVSVGGGGVTVTPGVGEIILEGFAPTVTTPISETARRPRGLANYGWEAKLAAWRKQREEEEEAEREKLRKQLEAVVGPGRAREYLERQLRQEAAQAEADTEEACLVAALTGDDDE